MTVINGTVENRAPTQFRCFITDLKLALKLDVEDAESTNSSFYNPAEQSHVVSVQNYILCDWAQENSTSGISQLATQSKATKQGPRLANNSTVVLCCKASGTLGNF